MTPVRFNARPAPKFANLLLAVFSVSMLGVGAYIGIPHWLSKVPTSFAEWTGVLSSLHIALLVLSVVIVPVSLIIAFLHYRGPGPDYYFLLLDQSGLTYTRHGKSRHWPWSVLPCFKMVGRYNQIHFLLPEDDTDPKRRDPWIHEVTPDGPVVAILDWYDTPLDEIAAKLNEYRVRARAAPSAP